MFLSGVNIDENNHQRFPQMDTNPRPTPTHQKMCLAVCYELSIIAYLK